MKYVITESRLERLAINWLNDNYGDLEPFETEEESDYIFYKKGNRVIFEYNKNSEAIYVDYDEIWTIFETYFTMEYEQIQHIIKMWVEEQYNLRVTTTRFDLFFEIITVEEQYNLRVTTTSGIETN